MCQLDQGVYCLLHMLLAARGPTASYSVTCVSTNSTRAISIEPSTGSMCCEHGDHEEKSVPALAARKEKGGYKIKAEAWSCQS